MKNRYLLVTRRTVLGTYKNSLELIEPSSINKTV